VSVKLIPKEVLGKKQMITKQTRAVRLVTEVNAETWSDLVRSTPLPAALTTRGFSFISDVSL